MKLDDLLHGERTPARKIALRLVLSYFALFSLRYVYDMGGGLETGFAPVDFLSKLPNSVYLDVYTDLPIFLLFFTLLTIVGNTGGSIGGRLRCPRFWQCCAQ